MPTEPLPPAQPQPGYATQQYAQPQYAQPQYVQQPAPAHYQPHADEPFYKRYGLAFAISTLILGAFVILGFVGAGAFAVGNFISHGGVGISREFVQGKAQPQPGAPGQGFGQGNGKGQGNGQGQGNGSGQGNGQGQTAPAPGTNGQLTVVRGTITDISGSTWKIDSQRGATVTVEVSSSTQFGTPTQSENASDFAVGQSVVVLGTRSGNTVTATRVLDLSGFTQQQGPGSPVTPGPTPSK